MKILIFSDSHGNTAPMIQTVQTTDPDLVLHLGDGMIDAEALHKHFPHIPLRAVRGNCDFSGKARLIEDFEIDGRRVIMVHGHRYKVKSTYADITRMGRETGADILLFGHTHIPYYEQVGDMHILNPGPADRGYGLIQIEEGNILCTLISL